MMTAQYPLIKEKNRPVAVSEVGQHISENIKNSYNISIGQSIFFQEIWKEKLKAEFEIYENIWKSETMFSSDILEITNNAAYRSIIGLGLGVLPLIIEDLKRNDNHWFYALESITGNNPIKVEHKGVVSLMKKDWLDWADENLK